MSYINGNNVLAHEVAIMDAAKEIVKYFMPVPGSYPPAQKVKEAVVIIEQLMLLVKAQQQIVIDSEAALEPVIDQLGDTKMALKEAEKRVIALEKMRDEAEQMYHDLANQMADAEQAIHDEYNSLQS